MGEEFKKKILRYSLKHWGGSGNHTLHEWIAFYYNCQTVELKTHVPNTLWNLL